MKKNMDSPEIKKSEYISSFIDKLNNINETECLHTNFGPMDKYRIIKNSNHLLFETERNYRYNWKTIFDFNNINELLNMLDREPYVRFYAENVFTGKVQHKDNIYNFLGSFMVRSISDTTEPY